MLGDQVQGWYAVDERSPEPHRGEEERDSGEMAHELAEAGAAYAGVGDAKERSQASGRPRSGRAGHRGRGRGRAAEERDEEGGGD